MLAIVAGALVCGTGAGIQSMLMAIRSSAPSSDLANVPTTPAPVAAADAPSSVKLADIQSPRTPAKPAPIETTDPPGFSVQVAAVPDVEDAQRMHAQLNAAGYHGYLTLTTVNQVRLYRVRVGPFRSRQTAQEIGRSLEGRGYERVWIDEGSAPSQGPVRSGPIFDDWHRYRR